MESYIHCGILSFVAIKYGESVNTNRKIVVKLTVGKTMFLSHSCKICNIIVLITSNLVVARCS